MSVDLLGRGRLAAIGLAGVLLVLCVLESPGLRAEEPLTLETAKRPPANSADEPLAKAYSLEKAVRFLDQASLEWTNTRKCFTCHTNFSYLMARPAVAANNKPHQQIRERLEEMVLKRWETSGPRWDAEVVMSAATLAMNDAATSGKLHPTSEVALKRMWTVQREDGGFDWLKCGWPPMESDDDYGASIALLAAHAAPGEYAQRPEVVAGLAKIHSYLKQNPPPTLHHQAMLMWADSYGAESLTAAQRKSTREQLFKLQKPDGGWALATLGDWKRADGKTQDLENSDGYATGFVLYVLRRDGVPADDPRIRRGVEWLKANQRESGRWFTRSLNRDSRHFISHAGSAFAVLALQSCEAAADDDD